MASAAFWAGDATKHMVSMLLSICHCLQNAQFTEGVSKGILKLKC